MVSITTYFSKTNCIFICKFFNVTRVRINEKTLVHSYPLNTDCFVVYNHDYNTLTRAILHTSRWFANGGCFDRPVVYNDYTGLYDDALTQYTTPLVVKKTFLNHRLRGEIRLVTVVNGADRTYNDNDKTFNVCSNKRFI